MLDLLPEARAMGGEPAYAFTSGIGEAGASAPDLQKIAAQIIGRVCRYRDGISRPAHRRFSPTEGRNFRIMTPQIKRVHDALETHR